MFRHLVLVPILGLAYAFSTAVSAYQLAPAEPAQQQMSATHDDRLIESGSYVNRAGNEVHRPAHTVSGKAPDGATAQCRDGSYSFSQSHRGTCSHHGGVSRWI
jgi:hypothetical protein